MASPSVAVVLLLAVAAVAEGISAKSAVYRATMVSPGHIMWGHANNTGVAWGTFVDSMNDTGWGRLDIHTAGNGHWKDEDLAYSAGFLEGALTHERMYQHAANMRRDLMDEFKELGWNGTDWPPYLTNWLADNMAHVRSEIDLRAKHDSYWLHVGYVVRQFEGLLDGFNNHTAHPMSEMDLMILQSVGDLDDLVTVVAPMEMRKKIAFNAEWAERHTHCTGLVKLLRDCTDWYFSQDTWSGMSSLNRIVKDYEIRFDHGSTRAQEVVFSSYPGVLFSVDDFYQTSAGLSVLETTFNIFNHSLYDEFVHNHTVLVWMRVQVANRMSATGKEWVRSIARINSGTYNNQWIAVDSKRFRPGKAPGPEFVCVVEMIPGHTWEGDVTNQLIRDTWYPSINTPSSVELFNLADFPKMVALNGSYWSYYNCSRYRIIARDAPKIETFEEFQAFMQYNEWYNDSLSCGDPAQSIASRYDLRIPGPSCDPKFTIPGPRLFGCLDSKCTSNNLTANYAMGFVGISGPPHHNGLDPFSFTEHPFEDVPPYLGLFQGNFTFPWREFSGTTRVDRCEVLREDDCDSCLRWAACEWCDGRCVDRALHHYCDTVYRESCPGARASHVWIYVVAVCGGVALAMVLVVLYYLKKTKLTFRKKKPINAATDEYEVLE